MRRLPLQAQPPEAFARRLRAGRPLFSQPRLESYVDHDLELIGKVQPHVIVGDFRLSLAASARKARAPYIAISNAYWSPDRPLRPVRPSLDTFAGWPRPLADAAFHAVLPAALGWHARPMDRLLAGHGLRGIGGDLRRAFTEADLTLFADLPALFPEVRETERRRFLGPVAWEPPVRAPAWWDLIPDDAPPAYLTLGSSGDAGLAGRVADWLGDAGFAVVCATAGRASLESDGRRLFAADYLPGLQACRRAQLVVCNGGSPTVTQALSAGRPVIGICSNLDQFLNMRAVEDRGAGVTLRADALDAPRFKAALERARGQDVIAAAAGLAENAAASDAAGALARAIETLAA